MKSVLEGIRVVDWTGFQVGPVGCAKLGDLGADVIKIEQLGRGDPLRQSPTFLGVWFPLPGGYHAVFEHQNRNKRGIAVDLRRPEGREVIYRLVEKSDVFLTNFRPQGVKARGLDYETLRKYNPKLIYVQSTGFGEKGPDADLASFDPIPQARSGLMWHAGERGTPPGVASPGIGDQICSINLAYGVLAALLYRERFGEGQKLSVSQFGSMIELQTCCVQVKFFPGLDIKRHSQKAPDMPLYNHYECKGGKWVLFAMFQDKFWSEFCEVIGLPGLGKDPKFDNTQKRAQNSEELSATIQKVMLTKTYEEWAPIFKEHDFIFSPVQTYDDLPTDPQVIENEYITQFEHPYFGKINYVGFPITFDKTPLKIKRSAPKLGQHTEEVLLEVGYTGEEIEELRKKKLI